jgi:hypothetical protein
MRVAASGGRRSVRADADRAWAWPRDRAARPARSPGLLEPGRRPLPAPATESPPPRARAEPGWEERPLGLEAAASARRLRWAPEGRQRVLVLLERELPELGREPAPALSERESSAQEWAVLARAVGRQARGLAQQREPEPPVGPPEPARARRGPAGPARTPGRAGVPPHRPAVHPRCARQPGARSRGCSERAPTEGRRSMRAGRPPLRGPSPPSADAPRRDRTTPLRSGAAAGPPEGSC